LAEDSCVWSSLDFGDRFNTNPKRQRGRCLTALGLADALDRLGAGESNKRSPSLALRVRVRAA
jgi:hypothetical protein